MSEETLRALLIVVCVLALAAMTAQHLIYQKRVKLLEATSMHEARLLVLNVATVRFYQ